MPLDPAREWLAAGITGLRARTRVGRRRHASRRRRARRRGRVRRAAGRVVRPRVVRRHGRRAVRGRASESIAPPYRALAVRRPELWAVGAVAIEVDRLDPDPRGNELGADLERIGARADDRRRACRPGAGIRARAHRRCPRSLVVRRPRAPLARRSLGDLRALALAAVAPRAARRRPSEVRRQLGNVAIESRAARR